MILSLYKSPQAHQSFDSLLETKYQDEVHLNLDTLQMADLIEKSYSAFQFYI